MNLLLKTMKQNKLTKNRVSEITGLSVPTVRKYVNKLTHSIFCKKRKANS